MEADQARERLLQGPGLEVPERGVSQRSGEQAQTWALGRESGQALPGGQTRGREEESFARGT